MGKKIAVVLPTIRPESLENFMLEWRNQFEKYGCDLIVVYDGKNPYARVWDIKEMIPSRKFSVKDIMGNESGLISNFNSSVRNLGFAFAKKIGGYDVIVTLDDDTLPHGDTIGDHLRMLEKEVPVSWISTTLVDDNTDYMRGFPYGVRTEWPVMLSHGVWKGVADRDALTQLVAGARAPVDFYRGPIPKGILFPFCGMNVAFNIDALPFVYYCPVGQFKGAERFDDIWGGIEMKMSFDEESFAVVSGYAMVNHNRASDPYKNLEREVIGIRENETYWTGENKNKFFVDFNIKRVRWCQFINSIEKF